MKTIECYRCHKKLAPSAFYHRADGSLIAGCRSCQREMSAQRRRVTSARLRLPALTVAADVVTTPAAPLLAIWRCECCRKRRVTELTTFPGDWKRVPGILEGEPIVACSRCARRITQGVRALRAVVGARTAKRQPEGHRPIATKRDRLDRLTPN